MRGREGERERDGGGRREKVNGERERRDVRQGRDDYIHDIVVKERIPIMREGRAKDVLVAIHNLWMLGMKSATPARMSHTHLNYSHTSCQVLTLIMRLYISL